MILASQCPLIPQSEQTCKRLDDTKPSTHDSVNNVLAWLANTLQGPRAAFRFAITALTPKSAVSTRFVSPEIIRILAKQSPLIDQSEQTCKAVAMDDTKPLTHDSVHNVLAWLANSLQAPRAAFRFAITALTPKSSVPAVSPEIIRILAKQCPLIRQGEPTCEVDAMDVTFSLLQTLRIVSRYAITALTIGGIVYIASSFTMLASKLFMLAIMLALGHSVFFGAPVATTALLIFGITIFASGFYFSAVIVKCLFKSPVKKRRVGNSTIAELCDDVFGYIRKVLFVLYCVGFGSWIIVTGSVGDTPSKLAIQVVGTMFAALIAKFVTEGIWYYFWLIVIHAYASTLQFLVVGPCCIAYAFVKNAIFSVFTGIFKTVKWILVTVFLGRGR
jgi:hypothetical protein